MIFWVLAGLAVAGVEVTDAPPGLEEESAPQRVALVVGINHYPDDPELHDLQFAAADAASMSALLDGEGYQVTTLSGGASEEEFRSALRETTSTLRRNDTFVMYIAGHAQLQLKDGEHALHLLFSDSRSDVTDPGLGVPELSTIVNALPALQRVVILDTCHSARSQQLLQRFRGDAAPEVLPVVGQFSAWVYSAAPQQSSQEDPALQHGVFTWYLLEALSGKADADGDGAVGVLEMFSWAGYHTAEHTQNSQIPSLEEDRIGWKDLQLTGQESGEPRYAIMPWYEEGYNQARIYLNGLLRGPGPVDPGRYTLEVYDGEERILHRSISLEQGEALPWSQLLTASQGRVLLGGGMGIIADGESPWLSGHGVGWFTPRTTGAWRMAFGALGFGGRVEQDTVEIPVSGGLVRAGVWWQSPGSVTLGPTLGAGALIRQPIGGAQLATTAAPGLHAHTLLPWNTFLSVDVTGMLFLIDQQPTLWPDLRISAGIRL
ncbi:MAG: caspase family protein [Myxococcota bacterium]